MRIVGMAMIGFGALLLYWIYVESPQSAPTAAQGSSGFGSGAGAGRGAGGGGGGSF